MDTANAGLDPEHLQKLILSWYAHPDRWKQRIAMSAYSSGPSQCEALVDAGRLARGASEARGPGDLLRIACDAYGVAITDLSRRSGVSGGRMAEIISGGAALPQEAMAIRRSLDEAVASARGS
jgi:hypothetical protein